eukprot:Opistho-2@63798
MRVIELSHLHPWTGASRMRPDSKANPLYSVAALSVCILLVAAVCIEMAYAQGVCTDPSSACAICPAIPSSPGDRRPNKNALIVAQFNAEFLFRFRPECTANTGASGCLGMSVWTTAAQVNAHLDAVAEIIRDLDADVLNLVEVEDCYILEQLNSRLSGMGYRYYVSRNTDTATNQHVALLTRVDPQVSLSFYSGTTAIPVPGSQCNASSSGTTSVSKNYYTEIAPTVGNGGPSIPIRLIGTHLKAFPFDPPSCQQREGQAINLRKSLSASLVDGVSKAVIMFGDLNDYDDNVTDSDSNVPVSRALSILRGTTLNTDASPVLRNVASLIPKQRRFSSSYYDRGVPKVGLIDHILVSDELWSRIVSVDAYQKHDAFNGVTSDHWPIVVIFDFGERKELPVRGLTFSDSPVLACGSSRGPYLFGVGCAPDASAAVTPTTGVPLASFANTTVTLYVQSLSGAGTGSPTYSWAFGDGTVVNTTSNFVAHTYAAPGAYQVSLTASNSASSSTVVRMVYAAVPQPSVLPTITTVAKSASSAASTSGPSSRPLSTTSAVISTPSPTSSGSTTAVVSLSSSNGSGGTSSTDLGAIIGGIAGGVAGVALATVCYFLWRRHRRKTGASVHSSAGRAHAFRPPTHQQHQKPRHNHHNHNRHNADGKDGRLTAMQRAMRSNMQRVIRKMAKVSPAQDPAPSAAVREASDSDHNRNPPPATTATHTIPPPVSAAREHDAPVVSPRDPLANLRDDRWAEIPRTTNESTRNAAILHNN